MAKWSKYNLFTQDLNGYILLFNTRTGALLRLNADRQREVSDPSNISHEFLIFLLEQGFLVGDDVNELQLIERVFESAKRNRDTFSATIELTTACNFRCVYCYQAHTPNYMGDQVQNKVIGYLTKQMRNVKHLHINWFGGEPLMRLGTLRHMSQRLRKRADVYGCFLSQFLTTNGYLITPAVARELVAIGIENVQITLDGDEESHNNLRRLTSGKGTYKRVLLACKSVVDNGIELLVRINLNRLNVQHIDNLLSDLKLNGITPSNTVIHVTRAVNHGNLSKEIDSAIFGTNDFADAWFEILQKISAYGFALPPLAPLAYNCPFDLKQTVMISSDGSILQCSSSNQRIADLNESGDELESTSLYREIKERKPWADLKCKECLYLPLCMGGCSYLQGIGEEKCVPEKYILPQLILLSIAQRKYENTIQGGEIDGS